MTDSQKREIFNGIKKAKVSGLKINKEKQYNYIEVLPVLQKYCEDPVPEVGKKEQ